MVYYERLVLTWSIPWEVSDPYPQAMSLTSRTHRWAGGDQGEVHGQPADGSEQAPAPVPLAELQPRTGIMISGDSGAVVASGGDAVTSGASYQLVKDVTDVVRDLPPRAGALRQEPQASRLRLRPT